MMEFIKKYKIFLIIILSILAIFVILIFLIDKDTNFNVVNSGIKNNTTEKTNENNTQEERKEPEEDADNNIIDVENESDVQVNDETTINGSNSATSNSNENSNIKENNNNTNNENSNKTENELLVEQIQNSYGIKVKYGDGTFYLSSPKVTDADEKEVNEVLNSVKYALSNIPYKILNDLKNNTGYSIEIFKELTGGKDGYVVYQPVGEQKIVLNLDASSRLLYHETWHLMEMYMYYQNNRVEVFSNWNSYNPAGFSYGNTNNSYTTYDDTLSIFDQVVISRYAKIDAKEDRAELFADLMFRTFSQDYMISGSIINNKAIELDKQIDKYFGYISSAKYKNYIKY